MKKSSWRQPSVSLQVVTWALEHVRGRCRRGLWVGGSFRSGCLQEGLYPASGHSRPWLAEPLIVETLKASLWFCLLSGCAWRISDSQSSLKPGLPACHPPSSSVSSGATSLGCSCHISQLSALEGTLMKMAALPHSLWSHSK